MLRGDYPFKIEQKNAPFGADAVNRKYMGQKILENPIKKAHVTFIKKCYMGSYM
jgi:hypothetical protein